MPFIHIKSFPFEMLKCIARSLVKRAPHRVAPAAPEAAAASATKRGSSRQHLYKPPAGAFGACPAKALSRPGMVFDNGEIVRW
ncbi:MAG: hypothetical protein ACREBU_11980 [Nitrososphaera sp.]